MEVSKWARPLRVSPTVRLLMAALGGVFDWLVMNVQP
jgi:hypothetical protein